MLKAYPLMRLMTLVSILWTSVSPFAQASVVCSQIYSPAPATTISLNSPTIQQWLEWEISPTVQSWAQSRGSSPLPIAHVKADSVNIEVSSARDVRGLESILNPSSIMEIRWFQHPYNQDKNVPNADVMPTEYGLAHHTASRTIVTEVNGRLVSIKMPTDHPFGPEKAAQPGKTKMEADLKYSVARSRAIEEIDALIGTDSTLVVQKEVAAVTDKKTNNGFLIRDMSEFKQGFYYLPAHLIPTIGEKIAEQSGKTVMDFWEMHWATKIGQLQAKLMYRYGIEVRAVNPQNFLIELDRNMTPTGVIMWRDLAESHLLAPIASEIGLKEYINRDKKNGGWGIHETPTVSSNHLAWNFNYSNPNLFNGSTPALWIAAHDQGFRREMEEMVGLKIPANLPLAKYLKDEFVKGASESELIKKITNWHRLKNKALRRAS